MDTKAITEHIHRILTAPDVDLATISSKKVRKVLAESFGASLVKENKEVRIMIFTPLLLLHGLTEMVYEMQAIDALIIDAFNRIATAAGATTVQPAPTHSHHTTSTSATAVKTEGNTTINNGSTSAPTSSHAAAHAESSNSSISHNNKQRDRQKQQQPEESEVSDEEDDASAASDTPPPQQKKSKPPPSSSNLKSSPQKRKIEDVASSSFPASSPNVPLSMTTGLTDEEYARKLQEEFNSMASLGGGRSTRGSGSRPSKKTKKSSTSKRGNKAESSNGSTSKYRSKAYIDDSDLEGEEGHGASDSGSDAAPKKKKRKAPSSSAGGSGGGYNKELALSESLQKVCGAPTVCLIFYSTLLTSGHAENLPHPTQGHVLLTVDSSF